MESVRCQLVAVQNGPVSDVNAALSSLSVSQNSAAEKVADAGSGNAAHKILQYGSRHTIQNTGWTTRLSCEPAPKRNPLRQPIICNTTPSVPKLPIPRIGTSLPPFYPRLPILSLSKPTVVKLHPPVSATAQGVQMITTSAANAQQTCLVAPSGIGMQQLSGGQSLANTNPLAGTNSVPILTLPAVDTLTSGKPPTVCFIPVTVSSVMCAPMPIPGMGTELLLQQNVASSYGIAQIPSGLSSFRQSVSQASSTQTFAASGGDPMVTNSATNPLSMVPTKEMLTWTPGGEIAGMRVLSTKVHIDHGHITEVKHAQKRETEPKFLCGLFGKNSDDSISVSSALPTASISSSLSHVDANGSQFGYYDLLDGTRVRLAHNTSGQRHAPFLLVPNPDDDSFPFEEPTVEVLSNSKTDLQPIPEEADVSGVGTVFSYEPLFVSEQTLMPVPNRRVRPPDCSLDSEKEESPYSYRCYVCPFASDDYIDVCKHWVNKHLADLPYRCPHCERMFFTSTRAQVHMQRQHGGKSTTVAFQRSSYFTNTLSYELGEDDADDESSDVIEAQEAPIVLESWQGSDSRIQPSDGVLTCRKCFFRAKSAMEMRHHLKFLHGLATAQVSGVSAGNATQQAVNGVSVQAKITWSDIWEEVIVAGELRFQCRWCSAQARSGKIIAHHIMREHHWPEAVLCPACSDNIPLTDTDYNSTCVACHSCRATVLLAPEYDAVRSSEVRDDVVYMCRICAFKTQGRDSMTRHIKYNHTKCRPYGCVYCNYVGVERSQVKLHVANHHPDKSVAIRERTEVIDQFQQILNSLFAKLVTVQTSDSPDFPPDEENDNSETESGPVVPSPFFACEECHFETASLQRLIRHQRQFHKNLLRANAAMIPLMRDRQTGESITPPGEHFKCKICGYCCLDRSCMSRHVKYMHITARPHSCMYCSYNNVEKTKVRLHVMAHHPGRQKVVRTDHKILEEMSWQAKHFYVRIDRQGNVVNESSGLNRNSNSPVDIPGLASPDSSDSELCEDILTSLPQSVPTVDDNSTPAKEEDVHADDVDASFRRKRTGTFVAALDSVYCHDHNYVAVAAPGDHIDDGDGAAFSDGMVIKEEPMNDAEYENCVARLLPVKEENDDELLGELKQDPDAGSLDSYDEMSDDDSDIYGTEPSDGSAEFESEHSDGYDDLDSVKDEPVRKKIRVAFGVDTEAECVMVIDSDVWNDKKIHMTPVVELEDVLEIILAWQQNVGESDSV